MSGKPKADVDCRLAERVMRADGVPLTAYDPDRDQTRSLRSHPGRRHRADRISLAGVRLRRATTRDSQFVYEVKRKALGEYVGQVWGWDEDEQRRLHQRRFASQDFRVIVVAGADAGVLALSHEADCLRVNQLLLPRDFQGKGVGTACMRQVLDDATRSRRPVRLQVLKVNRRVVEFYRRLGFRDAGMDEIHVQMEKPV